MVAFNPSPCRTHRHPFDPRIGRGLVLPFLYTSHPTQPGRLTDSFVLCLQLKKIAEGNPDEGKIGAFGVGFYSLFSVTEEPVVTSAGKWMRFYWKDGKDQVCKHIFSVGLATSIALLMYPTSFLAFCTIWTHADPNDRTPLPFLETSNLIHDGPSDTLASTIFTTRPFSLPHHRIDIHEDYSTSRNLSRRH